MADVVIRGMEMPTCCEDCRLFFVKNVCFSSAEYFVKCLLGATPPEPWPMRYERRAEDCPLIPLPKGHGPLIDSRSIRRCISTPTLYNPNRDTVTVISAKVLVPEEDNDV